MDSQRFPYLFVPFKLTFLLIGPIGVVAPMGLVPLLIVAGLCGLLSKNGMGGLKKAFPRKFNFILATFTLLAGISAAWAPDPARAIMLTLKLLVLCLLGLVVFRTVLTLGTGHRRQLENAILASMLFGFLILLVAFLYAFFMDDSLWGEHSGNPLTTLSRGEAVLALLTWPVVVIVWKRRGWQTAGALIAAVVLSFLALSNTAVLGSLAASSGVFAAVFLLRRKALVFFGVVFAVLTLLAPLAVYNLPSGDVMFNKAGYTYPSLVHRIYIWHFATDRILEKPVLGWGLDASRNLPGSHYLLDQSHFKKDLSHYPVFNTEIFPLHPHNAALQVWLELGVGGALLMAWLILAVYLKPAKTVNNRYLDCFRAAVATEYLVIGALSYGVWQNWWVALGWLATALIAACAKGFEESGAGPVG